MKLAIRSLLALAVLTLGIAPASRADDPKPAEPKPAEPKPAEPGAPAAKKTYRVLLRERWKAGDVVTRIAKESFSRTVEAKKGDEPPQKVPGFERQNSYVVVTKCLEANAEGYATKSLLYMTAWSIESGPQKDSSLAGVHIELTGLGAERTWKVVSPDAKPSPSALDWIEQFYGKKGGGDATYHDLEPKDEIEVGGSWEGDARSIAKRLVDRGISVDVEKSKAACTLVAFEDGAAHLQVKMSFPTTELKLPNGQSFPWKEGGILELNLDVRRPVTVGEFDAKIRREQKLAGIAQGGEDVSVTWEDAGLQEIEVKAGGKMPDVPAAAPAPADGEKKEPAKDDAPMGDGK